MICTTMMTDRKINSPPPHFIEGDKETMLPSQFRKIKSWSLALLPLSPGIHSQTPLVVPKLNLEYPIIVPLV